MSGDATHWVEWHRAYEDPGSVLARRLEIVEAQLRGALDEMPPGDLRVLSLCSGDARDLLDVLAVHPRARDVAALVVDLDDALLGRAASRAGELGLDAVSTRCADAGTTAGYVDWLAVDVLLACGIFGNVSDADVHQCVSGFPAMLRRGGHVLWTRHRRQPDLTGQIRSWLDSMGFEERAFVTVEGTAAAVGHHVWPMPTTGTVPLQLFRFVGDGSGARR